MKTIFRLFILVASLSALSSCTDVVQVKLDEGSKLYVIDAFVDNRRVDQQIRVVTNATYFSTTEPNAITNASVVLKDLNDNKQYTFNYTTNGYYTYHIGPADTIAKVNHQYELDITIDGYTYTSLITQKRPAIMDSIHAESTKNAMFGRKLDSTYFCVLYARDIVDANTDYYWIKTYRNDTLFNEPGDINICTDGTGGPITSAAEDTIPFSQPATLLGFKRYRELSTCKVEIYSITLATFNFFNQAAQQINNGGLFATTPENTKTNIVTPKGAKTNAVGWFSMSSVVSDKIIVK